MRKRISGQTIPDFNWNSLIDAAPFWVLPLSRSEVRKQQKDLSLDSLEDALNASILVGKKAYPRGLRGHYSDLGEHARVRRSGAFSTNPANPPAAAIILGVHELEGDAKLQEVKQELKALAAQILRRKFPQYAIAEPRQIKRDRGVIDVTLEMSLRKIRRIAAKPKRSELRNPGKLTAQELTKRVSESFAVVGSDSAGFYVTLNTINAQTRRELNELKIALQGEYSEYYYSIYDNGWGDQGIVRLNSLFQKPLPKRYRNPRRSEMRMLQRFISANGLKWITGSGVLNFQRTLGKGASYLSNDFL